jgi:transcription factor E2F2
MDLYIEHLHKGLLDTFLNNEENKKYTFLTYEDFQKLSKLTSQENGEALFIITAPAGTTLEYPKQENDS